MSISEGYILLYKRLLDWEWYEDTNVFRVFIHCLLLANYKTKKWRGIEIRRGQFISSRQRLAKELGLSEQQVRTALKKLATTNEVTSKGNPQHTVFTVENYDKYQPSNQQDTPSDNPPDNQQATTTNEVNNKNKSNKRPPKKRLAEDLFLSQEWGEAAVKYWATKNRTDLNPQEEFEKFKAHHLANGTTSHDFKYNWQTWYSNAIKYTREQNKNAAHQQQSSQHPDQFSQASNEQSFVTQDTFDELQRLQGSAHRFQ